MTSFVYKQAGNVHSLEFLTAFQFGAYTNETRTGFDVTDGVGGQITDHVEGSGFFYFDRGGGPTEGTITGLQTEIDGALNVDISGLELSAATLMHDLDLHNRAKLINDFLGGNDQELGSRDGDALYGYGGDDALNGRAGADHLVGGAGQDTLTGGAGADRFVFLKASDSTNEAPDTITDLTDKDVISLHRIDPDLHLVAAFDGQAHELVLSYDAAHDRTSLQADLDGDGKADMTVWISGDHHDFTNFAL